MDGIFPAMENLIMKLTINWQGIDILRVNIIMQDVMGIGGLPHKSQEVQVGSDKEVVTDLKDFSTIKERECLYAASKINQ
jgi:hypothetical protein